MALPLLAFFLLVVAVTIVVEGALSFLGLGVPPPTPSWGSMIGEGRENLDIAPWLAFMPAGFMFLTVLSFNVVGDTLRAPPIRGRERYERARCCRSRACGRPADAARRPARGRRCRSHRSRPAVRSGIVGESGCGKTMLSRADPAAAAQARAADGPRLFAGRDLVALRPRSCAGCAGPSSPSSSRIR